MDCAGVKFNLIVHASESTVHRRVPKSVINILRVAWGLIGVVAGNCEGIAVFESKCEGILLLGGCSFVGSRYVALFVVSIAVAAPSVAVVVAGAKVCHSSNWQG